MSERTLRRSDLKRPDVIKAARVTRNAGEDQNHVTMINVVITMIRDVIEVKETVKESEPDHQRKGE